MLGSRYMIMMILWLVCFFHHDHDDVVMKIYIVMLPISMGFITK